MNNALENKQKILSKTYWTTKDIVTYLEIGEKKAKQLKADLIKAYGSDAVCPFYQNAVNSNLFCIMFLKRTREEEINLFTKLISNNQEKDEKHQE